MAFRGAITSVVSFTVAPRFSSYAGELAARFSHAPANKMTLDSIVDARRTIEKFNVMEGGTNQDRELAKSVLDVAESKCRRLMEQACRCRG